MPRKTYFFNAIYIYTYIYIYISISHNKETEKGRSFWLQVGFVFLGCLAGLEFEVSASKTAGLRLHRVQGSGFRV